MKLFSKILKLFKRKKEAESERVLRVMWAGPGCKVDDNDIGPGLQDRILAESMPLPSNPRHFDFE